MHYVFGKKLAPGPSYRSTAVVPLSLFPRSISLFTAFLLLARAYFGGVTRKKERKSRRRRRGEQKREGVEGSN